MLTVMDIDFLKITNKEDMGRLGSHIETAYRENAIKAAFLMPEVLDGQV